MAVAQSDQLDPATPADWQRVRIAHREFDRRARVGGWFYVAAWLVIAYASDLIHRSPETTVAGVLLFAGLAWGRVLLRMPEQATPRRIAFLRGWHWGLMLFTAAIWCALYGWVLIDPQLAAARPAAMMCAVFFATAYANGFGMFPGTTALAICLIFLPGPLLIDESLGGGATRISLWVYAIYLLIGLLRSHRDYLERVKLEDELRSQRDAFEHLSRTDGLTGLLNRSEFSRLLAEGFERAQRSGDSASLVLLDIDHFKQVNDHLGHAVGDRCLVAFSARLSELLSVIPGHAVARWGGEEFAVWLPGLPASAARLAVETVLVSLRERPLLDDYPAITASAGVADLSLGTRSVQDWLIEVDAALYQAKRNGRDQVVAAGHGDSSAPSSSADVLPWPIRPKTSES